MATERLLERLHRWSNEDIRVLKPVQQQEQLLHSVQYHLSELLSTYQGSALIDPDLGLPNNLELLNLSDQKQLAEEICQQIKRYETRLANPQVQVCHLDQNPTQLQFSLSGQLGDDPHTVHFLVSIYAGQAKVLVEL